MRRRALAAAAALSAAAVSVAACSSGGSSSSPGAGAASGSPSASAPVASGQAATVVLPSDPGSLDPDLTSLSVTLQADLFLYDSLISFTPSGAIESNLAAKWSGTATTASYTLRKGVTCSDGSPLTASTVAANINFIGNVKNASSRVGVWVPPGATATGDDATGVVTVKSQVLDPFLVSDVGQTQVVCGNGMKDRSLLKEGADGTGMYTLTSAVPGSSYTLTLRKGYDWGPGGVTSGTAGVPATVTLKVVSNMTTAANELLAGQANVSEVVGPDTQRLASLYAQSVYAPLGELWFNEKAGQPTADVAVRKALSEGVQLAQLGQVLTSGAGKPATGLPLIVNATIAAGDALLAFAGLSFLGLGVQAPSYDWGQLLSDGLQGIYTRPAAALAPGVAVVVAGLAFNLFGEALASGLGVSSRLGRLRSALAASAAKARAEEPQAAARTDAAGPVLRVSDLEVSFPGDIRPVRGVSFTLGRGESVGVVGESGSGKSLTALAVARLLEDPAHVCATRLELLGQDLLGAGRGAGAGAGGREARGRAGGREARGRAGGAMSDRELRRFLGTRAGLVFQDPMTSFNPVKRIGSQLAEVSAEHHGLTRRQAGQRAVDRLRAVRIPRPEQRARQFPHELSGGMRQRAMIGMAIMGEPALLIADEPTTALDVTVQRQVLRLLKSIQAGTDGSGGDMALLFISHDITVVGQVCDRVLVMYAGKIVENLPTADLADRARHPYTRALLAAVPSMETSRELPLAVIPGRPANPADLPAGCAFAARCAFADAKCREDDPALVADDAGREVACWHVDRVLEGMPAAAATDALTADPESVTAAPVNGEQA